MLKTVFRRGWETYRREFRTIAPLVLVVLVPASILGGALRQLVDNVAWTGLWADLALSAASVALSAIGYFFLAGAIAEIIVADHRGTRRRTFRELALAIPYLSLIVVDLLVSGAVTAGLELLIIPGLIIAARFGLAPVVIEVEHKKPVSSLRRSFELSRRAPGTVGFVLLAVFVLTALLAVPVKLLAALILPDLAAEMVGLLVAGVIVKPLGAVIEVELALELIERKRTETGFQRRA